jgi:hypothetical protein
MNGKPHYYHTLLPHTKPHHYKYKITIRYQGSIIMKDTINIHADHLNLRKYPNRYIYELLQNYDYKTEIGPDVNTTIYPSLDKSREEWRLILNRIISKHISQGYEVTLSPIKE